MIKKGLLVASAIAALAILAGPVSADYELGGGDVYTDGTTRIEVEVSRSLAELVEEASASTGQEWVPVPILRTYDDEETGLTTPCRGTGFRAVEPGEDREDAIDAGRDEFLAQLTAYLPGVDDRDPYPACPTETAESLPRPVIEHAVRRAAIEQLPRPEPTIPPGYALTGLPAYLVTGHELTYGPVTRVLDFAPVNLNVTISAEGTSIVDWGDGTVTEHTVPGVPYPDGQMVHTYTHRDTYTVQIVDRWTVTYDVGGVLSGQITATLDPVTIDDFAAREYRAVRIAPDH